VGPFAVTQVSHCSELTSEKGGNLSAFVVVILPVTQISKRWTSISLRSAVKREEAVYLVRLGGSTGSINSGVR
jgi:hypothetical protein